MPDQHHVGSLPDSDLLALQSSIAGVQRQWDAAAALVAAEIVRRSSRGLGHSGLAQRAGARSPEKLIQQVTGVSAREARSLTRMGGLLDGQFPWLGAVARSVAGGDLSFAAAEAIIDGLGQPSATVAADDLADAAAELMGRAATPPFNGRSGLRTTSPEALAAEARSLRDDLDAASVADREHLMREKRYLRLVTQPDGMTRIIGLLDPESAAIITTAMDAVTSPRRGGPRFVDTTRSVAAETIARDERTVDQLTIDALVEMVRIATTADPGKLFGDRVPAVRIHVALEDLERRATDATDHGSAHLEGQSANISLATAERHICDTGYLPVLFDGDRAIDVGRAARLFTHRQRIALASRDGGCRWPGCDRPPSWTEAHHITPWSRGGTTDLAEGILLCRHHHKLLHNNGWSIHRQGRNYALTPPLNVDAGRHPIPMPRKRN